MLVFLDIVTTACAAILIGNEIAVSAFINPILWKLDERAQASAVSLFAARLGAAMPFWYVISLLLLILETILRRHSAGVLLLTSGCAIWVAVIILTLLFLVPINNRLARVDTGSISEAARREHRKWDTLHRLRIVALGASLVCFLVGIHR
ncbi:MAG: DUF1772 domain-containing protein [Terracidiphilus sp.]|jgi:uncharacterized membrane protein